MSDKSISLSFSYEWKLNYSMLETSKLLSEGNLKKVESERFGHFKNPEKFFLLLKVNKYGQNSANVQ